MKDREAWHAVVMGLQRVRQDLVTKQQQNMGSRCVGMELKGWFGLGSAYPAQPLSPCGFS